MTSLAGVLRSTPGVGACNRSTVPWTPFFDLGDGDADVGLKMPYCRSVLKLTSAARVAPRFS
jgi:hypothetical protein